jgi:hypothetical protein
MAAKHTAPSIAVGGTRVSPVVWPLVALMALIVVLATTARPSHAAGKPGGHSTSSGTLELVLVNSTDGLPHWGQQVTFKVSTTATTEPHVDLNCYQNGTLVYAATTGYYDSYPWPSTQIMTLRSNSWTGGDADCAAKLYYFDGRKTPVVATLSFHAYA